jgi:hypothetical protein
MDSHDQRVECAKEFDRIWEAIQPMQAVQTEQGKLLAKVETNTLHLIDSVKGLTTALWGIVLAAAGAGVMFIIWYVQGRV